MNQPTALDLTGGWESIVNNVERHNAHARFLAKAHKRKLVRSISKMLNYAIGSVLCVVLGASKLLAPWIAGAAGILLLCIACFLCGQIWVRYRQ